jgi:hypothetical protein
MASGKESGKAEGGGGEDEAYQGHEDHAEEGGVSSIDHDKEDFGPRLDTSSNLLSFSGGCLGGFVWTVCVQRENADRQQDKRDWIFTDSQAAVQRIASLTAAPGQDVALRLADIADTLHERNNSLHIQGVRGHVDVAGNERADNKS